MSGQRGNPGPGAATGAAPSATSRAAQATIGGPGDTKSRYVTTRSTTRGGSAFTGGLDLTLVSKVGPDPARHGPDGQADGEPPGLPDVRVFLGDQEISGWSEFHLEDDVLVLGFDLSAEADALCPAIPGLYLTGEARFESAGHTFTGTLSSICEDQDGTPAYNWKGTGTDPAEGAVLTTAITRGLRGTAVRGHGGDGVAARSSGTRSADGARFGDDDYDQQLSKSVGDYSDSIHLTEEDRQQLEIALRLSDEPKLLDYVHKQLQDDAAGYSSFLCYYDHSFTMWELSKDPTESEKFWAEMGRILTGLALMRTTNSDWRILDVQRMHQDLDRLLRNENPAFAHLAEGYYRQYDMGGLCLPKDTDTTFTKVFPENSRHTWQQWGERLAGLMTSPEYTAVEQARRQAGDEKWYQRLHCNLVKLEILYWASREPVEQYWKKQLGGSIPQQWQPGRRAVALYFPDDTYSYEIDLDKSGDWDWTKQWIDKYVPDYKK
ncbi:hypothetical protein [Actinomadura roseirufa]|uniref:hypothetical protein n=1 Tax=Actinomadura roseirufa TaxID=2094049 RepID=UPI0010416F95|nr:hypothetical protein [Actinomadura roseirufa]